MVVCFTDNNFPLIDTNKCYHSRTLVKTRTEMSNLLNTAEMTGQKQICEGLSWKQDDSGFSRRETPVEQHITETDC